MELIPDRASYRPEEPVRIELSAPLESAAELVVTHLQREISRHPVAAGATTVDLGAFERAGYGVQLAGARTAFDVLDDPFERPRYGFVVRLTDEADIPAVTRTFRRLHLSLAQLYDWAYTHSTLMPPTEHYLDPLGQERDIAVVNRMSAALAAVGTAPLGYSAVYAIGSGEVADWPGSILLRPDGEPYRLGENFLVLVDPSEPRWLEHYLGQLESVVRGSAIQGFHLDQYGWPKFAARSDGASVDLAEAFVTLLAAVRERLPETPFIFNNVNDFPTYATAGSPQNATYIEVWEPHSELQDLAALATAARALRPEHPPILSAYLSCYSEDEARANAAAGLVMATAFSHGATHLLLGEDGTALTSPYYPDNYPLEPESIDFFADWYDFAVRYGDLLFGEDIVDVTEFFTGGINEDVVFSGSAGESFSTKARAGRVWTRVVRTPHGIVAHLIDLSGQTETLWDAGKNPSDAREGLAVKIAPIKPTATVYFASVAAPDFVPLVSSGTDAAAQVNALSAGQSSVAFALPEFTTWGVLFIPAEELV